jgi:hypothetical protein
MTSLRASALRYLSTDRTVAPRDMREMFPRRAAKAGVGRQGHCHGLRHSHSVALDRAGTPVSATQSATRPLQALPGRTTVGGPPVNGTAVRRCTNHGAVGLGARRAAIQ